MQLRKLEQDKRGVTGGLVTSIIFGITSLVIGVIIALVITDTLDSSNLLTTESTEDNAVTNLTANFTSGIDKVSSKVPTVLLIGAIVLILAVLAVLVSVWQRMKFGGGTI